MDKIDRIFDIFLGYVSGTNCSGITDLDGKHLSVRGGVPEYDPDCVFSEDEDGVSFYLLGDNALDTIDFMTRFMETSLGIPNKQVHVERLGRSYRGCVYFSIDEVR